MQHLTKMHTTDPYKTDPYRRSSLAHPPIRKALKVNAHRKSVRTRVKLPIHKTPKLKVVVTQSVLEQLDHGLRLRILNLG